MLLQLLLQLMQLLQSEDFVHLHTVDGCSGAALPYVAACLTFKRLLLLLLLRVCVQGGATGKGT